jgi:hypothetical protein
MTDQYATINRIAQDPGMLGRVTACAAQQGVQEAPDGWAWENRHRWASAPGWGATWDSAVAGGIQDPGADPAVITDGMILAQLQAMAAAL